MIKTEAKCKVSGATIGRMEIKLGTTGEMTLSADYALQDDDGNIHARNSFVGPWPKDVVEAVDGLTEAAGKFLLSIHFEVRYDGTAERGVARDSGRPQGLFGTGLGHTGAEAPQLRYGDADGPEVGGPEDR